METLNGPARWVARLHGRRRLCPGVFEVRLERPEGFRFIPGQSVRLFVAGEGRDYSLTSPASAPLLDLCVRRVEGGAVSPALTDSPIGTGFEFSGPHGVFILDPSLQPAVFVATGVGIAPFLAMARSGARAALLLHGARAAGELLYRDELESAVSRYVPCLSREPSPGSHPGRVTNWARYNLAAGTYDFYLCGSRGLVRDFTVLVDDRFPGSRVRTEIFF